MRTWSLTKDSPLCLTLSADARFGPTDYANDQIWALHWWRRELPALHLETSYGRRTQSMQIFPAFSRGGETRQDPQSFAKPVVLQQLLPNLASLEFAPFRDLLVQAEYHVAESQVVSGRFTLHNMSAAPQAISLRLSAFLQPGDTANPMGIEEIEGVATLAGQATNIAPVVLLTGGARKVPAAYPSLQVAATLTPGGSKAWLWVHAGLSDHARSFEKCREWMNIPWDSTRARVELTNASMISIETGDPDWDAVLWMTQKEVLRSFMGPTAHNARPGLVGKRSIHDGYSLSSDGKDHTGPWGGLNTAETYFLARQALPLAPDLVKEVLRNILRTQNPAGELDWAPGMGGQRAGFQAMPILASLAWDCYCWTEDKDFLEEVFPGIFSFYESWFSQRHDQDLDGFPEWDHALQSGLENRPLFNRFDPAALGFDIAYAETIELAAFLFREGQALMAMAQVLDRKKMITPVEARVSALRARVEATWSQQGASYFHVDRQSHASQRGLQLVRRRGESISKFDRLLDPPARFLLRLKGDPSTAKDLSVAIVSRGGRKRKRTEHLNIKKFQSFWEWSTFTTDKLNHALEKISVKGIDKKLTMEILIPDMEREDIGQMLPLWSGWMEASKAKALVERTITNPEKYWQPNGMPTIPASDKSFTSEDDPSAGSIRILWNSIVGRGLVEQGFRGEAGQLFQKLMDLIVSVLKTEKRVYAAYKPGEFAGIGPKDDFQGLLPIDLFLEVLGVRFVRPTKLWVRPGHPFPWPVKIGWRGLSLLCERDSVWVRFPNGQEVTIEEGEGGVIEQLDSPGQSGSNESGPENPEA